MPRHAGASWTFSLRRTRLEPAPRAYPASPSADFYEKTDTYDIFRHPHGLRKGILRSADQGKEPVAELENDRPGGESSESGAIVPTSPSVDGLTGAPNPTLLGALQEAARQPRIGRFGKMLVSMQLSAFGDVIMRWCGPIDLVTAGLRRLE
jgi:hypothetical protein